jgi:hypothetical protein
MKTPTIIRCPACNTTASFVATYNYNNGIDGQTAFDLLVARGGKPSFSGLPAMDSLRCCGRSPKMVEVKGTFRPAHKCDARCLTSTGGKCECACGGKNHGMNYAGAC